MPKNRLFKIENKKSEKKVKTQMHTNFFRDLHLISSFKCSKKNVDFFDRV
jgi:hypothetical protein